MHGHQCLKCRTWWASQAGPDKRFDLITRFCPYCLANMGTVMTPTMIERVA